MTPTKGKPGSLTLSQYVSERLRLNCSTSQILNLAEVFQPCGARNVTQNVRGNWKGRSDQKIFGRILRIPCRQAGQAVTIGAGPGHLGVIKNFSTTFRDL